MIDQRDETAAGGPWVARWWAGGYGARGELLRAVTLPLEAAYRMAIAARNRAYDAGVAPVVRLPLPVVSVGNLAVGGAGKTPVSAWIAAELAARGHRPAVLHGGHAEDEPELHRRWNPAIAVYVGRDRAASGRRAAADGATALVLDDAFQHRRVARDVDLVLVAAENWTPTPRLLPRGPWREGPGALRRASHVAVTRKTVSGEVARTVVRRLAAWTDAPIAMLALRPGGWRHRDDVAAAPPSEPGLAVAAIAQPELFRASARMAGADVADLIAFPDHHRYDAADARRVLAAASGRPILTTEKDWVKLGGLLGDSQVWMLLQRVELEEGGEALRAALDGIGR
jgi:tetraacyldisaccharide 4'-kinase